MPVTHSHGILRDEPGPPSMGGRDKPGHDVSIWTNANLL